MGLIDKIKGILFDEEVEEIPEIKEEKRIEVKEEEKNPIKEIKIPKEPEEIKPAKTEPSFTFPIDFNDEEEEKEPVPRYKPEEIKKTIKKETIPSKDYSSYLNKKEEKKQFRPTPIISPVYGILDQNYKKEDVIVKKDILRRPNELSLEEVRKRAFGSLEDEIEQNLTSTKEEEKIVEMPKEIIEVEEPVDKSKTIGELIEEDALSINVPEIKSINEDEEEYTINDEDEIVLEEPQKTIEDLFEKEQDDSEGIEIEDYNSLDEEENNDENEIDEEEADLFSLIDSMYEEKGE